MEKYFRIDQMLSSDYETKIKITDLMIKILRHGQHLEMAVMVGIDPQSDGLARARRMGVTTTHEGVIGLMNMPEFADIDIVFDATSAGAHVKNDAALRMVSHAHPRWSHQIQCRYQEFQACSSARSPVHGWWRRPYVWHAPDRRTEDQCRPSPPSPDADRDAKF